MDSTLQFFVGQVLTTLPTGGRYYVSGVGINGIAVGAGATGSDAGSLTDRTRYAAGQVVYGVQYYDEYYILGALPDLLPADADAAVPFLDMPGGSVGSGADVTSQVFDKASMDSRTAQEGLPLDALAGEAGVVSPLGVGTINSVFYAALSAGATAEVSVHFMDQLLRTWGYNRDDLTSLSRHVLRNDGGKAFDVAGWAKYPTEALGTLTDGQPAFKVREQALDDPELLGKYGPAAPNQQPFFRLQRHRGLLGDLERTTVAIPAPGVEIRTAEKTVQELGVLEQHIGADGSYSLLSGHSIILGKLVVSPLPHQLAGPDDTAGDTSELKPVKIESWSTDGQGDNGVTLLDRVLHAARVAGRAQYKNQAKDWYVPAEKEVLDLFGLRTVTATAEELEAAHAAPWTYTPTAGEVPVCLLDGNAKYTGRAAFIAILENGDVVLENGAGAQIAMCGSTVRITAPEDIVQQTGNDMIALVGGHSSLRARGNVELSSAQKNVRIKAEKNIHTLAGNGGTGGIVLESRSTGSAFNYDGKSGDGVDSSGVVVRCPNSGFAAWAPNIYMGVHQLADTPAGSLTLVSDNNAYSASKNFEQIVESAWFVNIKDTESTLCYGESGMFVSGGNIVVSGGGLIAPDGDVICSGTVAGKQMVHPGTSPQQVLPGGPKMREALTDIKKQVDDVTSSRAEAAASITEQMESSQLQAKDSRKNVGFSFRNDREYTDVIIPQARWQQYLGSHGEQWVEPPVLSPGGETTFPYPGGQWESSIFLTLQAGSTYDINNCVSLAAGTSTATTTLVSPADNYRVLARM